MHMYKDKFSYGIKAPCKNKLHILHVCSNVTTSLLPL